MRWIQLLTFEGGRAPSASGWRPRIVQPSCEYLEERRVLSGPQDMTGSMGITMPFGLVPNFGANPTVAAVRSGAWSDAGTWSTGKLPRAGDVVSINSGVTVQYDAVSDVHLDTVVVQDGGELRFRTDVNTRLVVANILVLEGGYLEVGTPERPVAADVTAEIVIADKPIDTDVDPEQFGTGLLAMGKVTMHGATKDATFARLAVEPAPGDTTLTLSRPVTGWRTGDQLVLPPTGGTSMFFQPRSDEVLTVASVSGNVVTLASPLQGVHQGARDAAGNLDFLPHVGNLTRNVLIRSENPQGTRGHTMFMDRADVDLEYVQFKDLGRTTGDPLDSTTFDEQGMVTHVGTNQIGRYPLHFHHVLGPENPANAGYQFRAVGDSIDGGLKWGLTLHDSHYGLVKDNVIYGTTTAGLVTEDGSESYDVLEHNFVTGVDHGDAFWLQGTRNYIRDNVAGRAVNGFYLPPNLDANKVFLVPAARGDESRGEEFSWIGSTFLEFARNEAYAVRAGLYIDHRHGGAAQGGALHQGLPRLVVVRQRLLRRRRRRLRHGRDDLRRAGGARGERGRLQRRQDGGAQLRHPGGRRRHPRQQPERHADRREHVPPQRHERPARAVAQRRGRPAAARPDPDDDPARRQVRRPAGQAAVGDPADGELLRAKLARAAAGERGGGVQPRPGGGGRLPALLRGAGAGRDRAVRGRHHGGRGVRQGRRPRAGADQRAGVGEVRRRRRRGGGAGERGPPAGDRRAGGPAGGAGAGTGARRT